MFYNFVRAHYDWTRRIITCICYVFLLPLAEARLLTPLPAKRIIQGQLILSLRKSSALGKLLLLLFIYYAPFSKHGQKTLLIGGPRHININFTMLDVTVAISHKCILR